MKEYYKNQVILIASKGIASSSSLFAYQMLESVIPNASYGVISGGMIPKVDCCIEAISKGVRKVIIMDGRIPHSILMELLTNEGAGTMVLGD